MCSSCELAKKLKKKRKFPTPHIIFKKESASEGLFTKGTSLENRLEQVYRKTGQTYLLSWTAENISVIRNGT